MPDDSAGRQEKRLVIFDYSGTLSLEAVIFARPDNLMQSLKASGLADLGIDTPQAYWDKVVNPTWHKASISKAGYATFMEECIRQLTAGRIPSERIAGSVAAFIKDYLTNSRIDQAWKTILQELERDPAATVIVATDHYAEASQYILRYLDEFGIGAVMASDIGRLRGAACVVANSADIGALKADKIFWQTLKNNIGLDQVNRILIVDDFGLNESESDDYGERQKVFKRKQATLDLLSDVFNVRSEVFVFMLEKQTTGSVDQMFRIYRDLIGQATLCIKKFIKE